MMPSLARPGEARKSPACRCPSSHMEASGEVSSCQAPDVLGRCPLWSPPANELQRTATTLTRKPKPATPHTSNPAHQQPRTPETPHTSSPTHRQPCTPTTLHTGSPAHQQPQEGGSGHLSSQRGQFQDYCGSFGACWTKIPVLTLPPATCPLHNLGQVWTPCQNLSFLICKMGFLCPSPRKMRIKGPPFG